MTSPLRTLALLSAVAIPAMLASPLASAGQVKLFRDMGGVSHARVAAHCGCARATRHVARAHLGRGRHVARRSGGALAYDWPPTQNYEVVGWEDGPHLGPNGAEGSEPGYGQCRWTRVAVGGGTRWSKVCGRAGYFTLIEP